MQSYIRKILQPENLPNWVSLIAIVAVLWTLNSELSRQSLEETKLVILKQLSNTATPMKLEQVITDGYLAAISELVADGLVLQTSQGYEIRRYDPRIKDDISIAISLVFGWRFIKSDQHNNAHCGCGLYFNGFSGFWCGRRLNAASDHGIYASYECGYSCPWVSAVRL